MMRFGLASQFIDLYKHLELVRDSNPDSVRLARRGCGVKNPRQGFNC